MGAVRRKFKLVFGVGINDADYKVCPQDSNGVQQSCRFYLVWRSMLGRCYSTRELAKYPTYIGCTVTPAWHYFMTFRAWMMEQDWQGKHLDKDIIVPGNRVYGPDTCCFVPAHVNTLIEDSAKRRGNYPLGVSKFENKFKADSRQNGKTIYLGLFDDPNEAHKAYLESRRTYIKDVAHKQSDPRVRAGLLAHARLFEQKEVT